jgi:hypothetical protein
MHPLVAVELHRANLITPVAITSRLTAQDRGELLLTHDVEFADATGVMGIEKETANHIQLFVRDSKEVISFPSIAREFGISAALSMNRLTPQERESFPSLIADECEKFLQRLVLQVERGALDVTRRELVFHTLLSYADRHTMLIAEPSGIAVRTSKSVAGRVLNLPIVPTNGVLVSPMRVIRDFISAVQQQSTWNPPWDTTQSDTVFDILHRLCDQARILKPPSQNASQPAPTQEHTTLFEWITESIARLSPVQQTVQINPVQGSFPNGFLKHVYDSRQIYRVQIAIEHPFVQSVLKGETDRNLLMLAVFASLNTVYREITNPHEMVFQSRVIDEIFST